MNNGKDDLVYKAKLAEQTERYEEMVDFMTEVANICASEGKAKDVMTLEERNLLSVAYKNVIGARRAAWRVICSLEKKETGEKFPAELLNNYKHDVEVELEDTCKKILDTLQTKLIPNEEGCEAKVFFLKMKGDYNRYIAEIEGDSKDKSVEESENAYKEAGELAKKELPPTHPIRLGLALNFSVYFYEIKKDPGEACKYAKEAFDEAIAELDGLSEDSYKDSTLIMQLLRDNLTLWASDEDKTDTVVQDLEQDD